MCFCARLGSIHRVACVGGLPTGRAPRCRGRDHLLCRALPPRRSCCTRLHAARWSPRPQPILIAKRSTSSGAEGQGGGRTAGPTPLTPVFSGLLCRWPGVERVTNEQEPHRPVPGSVLGKVMPGLEECRQCHDGRGEPDDLPDAQDPRRRARRRGHETGDGNGQPDQPHPEAPDGDPPASVALLQFRRALHASHCPTFERARSLVVGTGLHQRCLFRPYEAPGDPGETNRSLPRFQG
jgi:hypothetical protein